MKVLVVGDCHGNLQWTKAAAWRATALDCTAIMQVGDWGFNMPFGDDRLEQLSDYLKSLEMPFYFVAGNHDNHPLLAHLRREKGTDENGFVEIAPYIYDVGRVNQWIWNGKLISAVAGAVSIDRTERVRAYKNSGIQTWFPDEILSEEEWYKAQNLDECDVLFSHDAPLQNPFNFLKQDVDSEINRRKMTKVAQFLRPSRWFTGHYHIHAKYPFYIGKHMCEVTTLNCDGTPFIQSTEVLDLT